MTAKLSVCLRCDCLKKLSHGIITGLEIFFYKLGALVARNPWRTIALTVLVCGLMGTGLIRFHEETGYMENWIPHGSRIFDEHKWISENFPETLRVETMIIEDENVLSPESINAMFDVYETARNLQISVGDNITNPCAETCRASCILDIWSYDGNIIRNLTEMDIVRSVNFKNNISLELKNKISMEKILSNIRRNDEGDIIGAEATTMLWFLEVNGTTKSSVLKWEKHFIDLVNNDGHPHLQNIYIYSPRTYDDEIVGTVMKDVKLLMMGFGLVFIYLTFSISKISLVHHRVFLALAGLFSIGLAISFTYGFAFFAGIIFGPLHQGLPFLILGVGVDDMFVIMESLNHLTPAEKELPLERRIAHTMKHAGVSITVTSITDIVAFAIGSSTVIPGLSTFCIYAAIAVFALYVLQITFFVACLTVNERRQESLHNAFIICYKHQDTYKPNRYYTFSVQHTFMEKVWAPALTKAPVKVFVICFTVGLTSLNVWSFCHLPQEYDPSLYLPLTSYGKKYVDAGKKYFPDDGAFVELYCGKVDFPANIDRMLNLYDTIRQRSTVQSTTVDFWLTSYQRWLSSNSSNVFSSLQNDSVHSNVNINPCILDTLQYSGDTVNNFKLSNNSSIQISNLSASDNVSGQATHEKSRRTAGANDTVGNKELQKRSIPLSSNAIVNYSTSDTNLLDPSPGSSGFPHTTCGFIASLLQFLSRPEGQMYFRSIKFDNTTGPSHITGSRMTFRHVQCQSSKCSIEAMDDMRDLVDNFSLKGGGACFVYASLDYFYNETNKVIKMELYRNLALAAVAVFVVTLMLITNLWTSFLVFICVLITIIDVAGIMNFWNITIDTCSSVLLILCFGLAVDFSAHIGHSFMTKKGSKNERLVKTMVSIGPAVFSGGFSTFLAFIILCRSSSYAFLLFFRIFTLVVAFGLFHGLTFLPVILSVVGPPPYETKLSADNNKFSKQNGDIHDSTLPNGIADVEDLKETPFLQRSSLRSTDSLSVGSLLDQYIPEDSQHNGARSPRYSGSYYEQMSSGSWAEIPPLET